MRAFVDAGRPAPVTRNSGGDHSAARSSPGRPRADKLLIRPADPRGRQAWPFKLVGALANLSRVSIIALPTGGDDARESA